MHSYIHSFLHTHTHSYNHSLLHTQTHTYTLASVSFMPDGYDGLEVYQFSVDVFNWSKPIFLQLGFCTYGEQWTNATFPNYLRVLEILGAMVQLEYAKCLHFWFASWGEQICSQVKRTSFVAIDSAREVTKSKPWRERTLQGHISSYSPFELVCRVALSLES